MSTCPLCKIHPQVALCEACVFDTKFAQAQMALEAERDALAQAICTDGSITNTAELVDFASDLQHAYTKLSMIEAIEAERDAARKERDGWQHRADSIETQRDDYWRVRLMTLETRLSTLREAVRTYGRHFDGCGCGPNCVGQHTHTICTCGLAAVLSTPGGG